MKNAISERRVLFAGAVLTFIVGMARAQPLSSAREPEELLRDPYVAKAIENGKLLLRTYRLVRTAPTRQNGEDTRGSPQRALDEVKQVFRKASAEQIPLGPWLDESAHQLMATSRYWYDEAAHQLILLAPKPVCEEVRTIIHGEFRGGWGENDVEDQTRWLARINLVPAGPKASSEIWPGFSQRVWQGIQTFLYAYSGRNAAARKGRRAWNDNDTGDVLISDTPENIRGIEAFLNGIPDYRQRAVLQTFELKETDPQKVLGEIGQLLGLSPADLQAGRIDWKALRQAPPKPAS